MILPFLKNFKKELDKLVNVTFDFRPPSCWYSTGNYAANRIISGDFRRGIPQGRVTILAGPSDCITGDQKLQVYLMKTNPRPYKSEEVE